MEILESKNVYSGFLKMDKLLLKLPNGETISREVIKKKNAVCIVPVTEDGMMYLTKQPRAGREIDDSIEFPAGLVEDSEDDFLSTAKRELLEETGCIADRFIDIISFYSDPACCTSETHLFLALGVKKVQEQELDFDEFLTVFKLPIKDVYKLLEEGQIKDVNSIIGLLKSKEYLKNYNI